MVHLLFDKCDCSKFRAFEVLSEVLKQKSGLFYSKQPTPEVSPGAIGTKRGRSNG
jgi:hypothetical protein